MPWRLLLLLLFFAAKATGQSVTARCNATIAPNDLATLVTSILDKLGSQSGRLPMFSLAVNIPCDPISNTYDPNRVNLDGVKKALLDCEVDSNRDVVAATLLKWDNVLKYCPDALVPWEDVLINCKKDHITWRYVEKHCPEAVKDHAADHAEYRVLERFQSWAEGKDKSGLLLFYVYASPCTDQCTHKNHARSILSLVKAITGWEKHAMVFSKIFKPKNSRSNAFTAEKRKSPLKRRKSPLERRKSALTRRKSPLERRKSPLERRKSALKRLGMSLGGLQNLFRCDEITNNGKRVCHSCSSGGDVTPLCYDYNVQISLGGNKRNWVKGASGSAGEKNTRALSPLRYHRASKRFKADISDRERGPSERRKGREREKHERQRAPVGGRMNAAQSRRRESSQKAGREGRWAREGRWPRES
ncbi:uncharacterized protein LOC144077128 isoform X1 [Stigmatopora argus]